MGDLNDVICVIKLVTDEVIFALVESEDETVFVVEMPIAINETSKDAWEYATFTDQKVFPLKKKHIVYIETLNDEYTGKYLEIMDRIAERDSEKPTELKMDTSSTVQ